MEIRDCLRIMKVIYVSVLSEHIIYLWNCSIEGNPFSDIPTKMLASPIFHEGRPLYMNFGAGGMALAHEIYPAVATLADTSDQAECFSHLFDDLKEPELQNMVSILLFS